MQQMMSVWAVSLLNSTFFFIFFALKYDQFFPPFEKTLIKALGLKKYIDSLSIALFVLCKEMFCTTKTHICMIWFCKHTFSQGAIDWFKNIFHVQISQGDMQYIYFWSLKKPYKIENDIS